MNEANPAQLVPYVTGGAFAEDTANHVLGGSAATMKYQYWRLSRRVD
jgi:hypothetical protein